MPISNGKLLANQWGQVVPWGDQFSDALLIFKPEITPPPWMDPVEVKELLPHLKCGHEVYWIDHDNKVMWLSTDLVTKFSFDDCVSLDKLHKMPILEKTYFGQLTDRKNGIEIQKKA